MAVTQTTIELQTVLTQRVQTSAKAKISAKSDMRFESRFPE